MAVGGRKPKPTEQKRVTGNPGRRPLPTDGITFTGELVAPKWFRKLEREEWDRLVPQLDAGKIVGTPHQGALEGICALYATWRERLKAKDHTQFRQAYDAYRKALNEFGLTPASQARVGGSGGDGDKDPAEEFFEGPRLATG